MQIWSHCREFPGEGTPRAPPCGFSFVLDTWPGTHSRSSYTSILGDLWLWVGVPWASLVPLPYGIFKAVKARFWLWLAGKKPETLSSFSLFARKRSLLLLLPRPYTWYSPVFSVQYQTPLIKYGLFCRSKFVFSSTEMSFLLQIWHEFLISDVKYDLYFRSEMRFVG